MIHLVDSTYKNILTRSRSEAIQIIRFCVRPRSCILASHPQYRDESTCFGSCFDQNTSQKVDPAESDMACDFWISLHEWTSCPITAVQKFTNSLPLSFKARVTVFQKKSIDNRRLLCRRRLLSILCGSPCNPS